MNISVCSFSPGLVNIRKKASPSGTEPKRNHGRLLPHRVRVRSERKPTVGSVTASHILPSIMATPAKPALRPTSSVKKFKRRKASADQNKQLPSSPTPYPSFIFTGREFWFGIYPPG